MSRNLIARRVDEGIDDYGDTLIDRIDYLWTIAGAKGLYSFVRRLKKDELPKRNKTKAFIQQYDWRGIRLPTGYNDIFGEFRHEKALEERIKQAIAGKLK